MKLSLFIVSLVVTASAFAQSALHEITFKDNPFVSFPEPRPYSIYPLSERAMPAMQNNTGRKIIAADYITGIKIKTANPDAAAQMILSQIASQSAEIHVPKNQSVTY